MDEADWRKGSLASLLLKSTCTVGPMEEEGRLHSRGASGHASDILDASESPGLGTPKNGEPGVQPGYRHAQSAPSAAKGWEPTCSAYLSPEAYSSGLTPDPIGGPILSDCSQPTSEARARMPATRDRPGSVLDLLTASHHCLCASPTS